MATALSEANLPDINERINRHYGNDVHPLSGLLAWKMLCDEQERDAHENVAAWLVRAHCIVQEGRKIDHPTALMPWVRAIDTVGDKLLNLDIKADQIASMTIHMVLETIACKHGEKWEPWRAIARELQREVGSKGKACTWRRKSSRWMCSISWRIYRCSCLVIGGERSIIRMRFMHGERFIIRMRLML